MSEPKHISEIIKEIMEELSDEKLDGKSQEYAEQECSCYTNDYYGYLNGAKDVRDKIVGKLQNEGL